MGLHKFIEVKWFEAFGFKMRGLFATAVIQKGEEVWWHSAEDDHPDVTLHLTRAQLEAHPRADTLKMYSYMKGIEDPNPSFCLGDRRSCVVLCVLACSAADRRTSWQLTALLNSTQLNSPNQKGMDNYCTTLEPESDTSWFFNHTCDPNCYYVSDVLILALRDIHPGEQVAYDYAFTETESSFHAGMVCGCGAPQCRGPLKFEEYRSPSYVRKWRHCLSPHIKKRADESSWFDPRVYPCHIEELDNQWGLRALAPIKRGEIVLVWAGKVVSDKYALDLDENDERSQELSLQVHDHLYQVPSSIFSTTDADACEHEIADLINHSCDPNCGQLDSVTIVAMRDISAGEHITFDYCMSSTAPGLVVDPFDCRCGTKLCRGRVQPGDWQRKDLQDRYWGFFAPHIRLRIEAMRPELVSNGSKNKPAQNNTSKQRH
jgi:hypothetical protein